MADKKDKHESKRPERADATRELGDAADALRQAALRGRRHSEESTTLEVDDPASRVAAGRPPDALGELLVSQGVITRHQLFNALNESYRTGDTLEQALIALQLVDQATLDRLKG